MHHYCVSASRHLVIDVVIFLLFQICTFIYFDILYIVVSLLCGPWLEWCDSEMAIPLFPIRWSASNNLCNAICYLHGYL